MLIWISTNSAFVNSKETVFVWYSLWRIYNKCLFGYYNKNTNLQAKKSFKDQCSWAACHHSLFYWNTNSFRKSYLTSKSVINAFRFKKYLLLEKTEFTKHSWECNYAKLIQVKLSTFQFLVANLFEFSKIKTEIAYHFFIRTSTFTVCFVVVCNWTQ